MYHSAAAIARARGRTRSGSINFRTNCSDHLIDMRLRQHMVAAERSGKPADLANREPANPSPPDGARHNVLSRPGKAANSS